MKTTIKYCLFILMLLFASCENREWDNPFDPDCPKELFTPANFTAKQEGNLVKLTWSQSNTQISGFVIERSVDGATWSSVATPAKAELTWSDSNITGGKVHAYRIVAKAGTNRSNEVTAQVTPVFDSTLTTKPLTKLLSTSAVLGGEITSDGGSPVTARGVCWNTSPNPTISNSKTTDGTGTGTFTSTITGLNTTTTYYARAYASTSVGTSYGNEITFKTFFGEVTDIEGNVYPTVKIGEQVWMAENLKTTKYNDGTAIPNVTDNTAWAGLTTGAYCLYNNDINLKNIYGAIYNWYTMNTGKLAPEGWHVATDAEWTTLTDYLSGETVAGGKLKEIGTSHWQSPNTGATNESVFSALPGGSRNDSGTFGGIGNYGHWWSSTEHSPSTAWYRALAYSNSNVAWTGYLKEYGFSVRCILGTLSSPTVSTTAITNKTTTSATSGGNITSDGGAGITARGVCWSTSPNPTTANSKTTDGTGTGSFTSNITGLTANTIYYVRAYAINSQGTAYGAQVSFTTSQTVSLATVATTTVTTFTTTTAVLGGNVTSDGNATVTERGVVYATTQNPTTSNTKVAMGSGTGSFSNTVSGLTANTTYYVRSYALNSQGTAYGAQVSFTTSQLVSLATVTTAAVTTFTTTTAVLGGNVTSDGNATVTERGVVYATTQNPTTANMKVAIGTGTGSFSNTVSGLTANTTYYARSYAINSQGTAYGAQVSFTTSQLVSIATVTTSAVTTFIETSAILGGNVTNDGNATVTERGVVYATTQNPTTDNTKVTIGNGTGTFSNTVSGLTVSTTYYVRAYATNSQGTAYGEQENFTTKSSTAQTVTDVDGNVYKTVTIGIQVWIAEDLKTTKYNDGTPIPNITDNTTWAGLTTGAYCWYNNDISFKTTYGALYNWHTVSSGKLCLQGWHVPTNAEWTILTNYLGGETVAGGKMKETGTAHWKSPNAGANNSSGFSALPGGYRIINGSFSGIGSYEYWWSSTEHSANNASNRLLYYSNSDFSWSYDGEEFGCSVRCVRD